MGWRQRRPRSHATSAFNERIEELNACATKITDVAGRHGEPVGAGDGSDGAVGEIDGATRFCGQAVELSKGGGCVLVK
jgi:hypothetical protein